MSFMNFAKFISRIFAHLSGRVHAPKVGFVKIDTESGDLCISETPDDIGDISEDSLNAVAKFINNGGTINWDKEYSHIMDFIKDK